MILVFLSSRMIESRLKHPPPISSFQVRLKIADCFNQQKDREGVDDCRCRDLLWGGAALVVVGVFYDVRLDRESGNRIPGVAVPCVLILVR